MNISYIKYIYVAFLLWGCCLMAGAQSSNQNYIRTRTYTNTNAYLDKIQYYDGLGRPSQAVAKGITPDGQDLISLQEYDGFGRAEKAWLPGKVTGNNGAYFTGNISEKATATNSDARPFSQASFEPSPLNRVTASQGPGQEWEAYARKVKTDYLTNTVSGDLSCGKYILSGESITRSGVFPTGELYVIRLTDEDNNISYEFKDKLDRVLLQRKISEGMQHDTYFLYDDFNNLSCVLPPMAVEGMQSGNFTFSSTAVSDYAYLYRYDQRNRCIEKKLPGTAWMHRVYDRSDRVVLLQDGEQGRKGEWTFHKYDALGRPVLSGVKSDATPAATYQNNYRESLFVHEYTGTGLFGYGAISTYPVNQSEVYEARYYDDYRWINLLQPAERAVMNDTTRAGFKGMYNSSKGMLTGTRTFLLDGSTEIITVYHYDERGQVVRAISKNHAGGYDRQYTAYNYDGSIEKRLTEHTGPSATAVTELYSYQYDHAGRLVKTTYKLNNENPVVMAEYGYNDLGRLASKKLAGGSSWNNYTYNVRGWTDLVSGNKLSQWLRYNEAGAGYFGGNIYKIDSWVTGEDGKGYQYAYDNLGRLTGAVYGESDNQASNRNRFSEHMTYDKQGNLKTLKRYGLKNNGVYDLVDNLAYDYSGNLATGITDLAGSQGRNDLVEFQYAPWFSKYGYDGNGSLTYDGNRSICSIEYNSLNLPRRIQHQKGDVAEYAYDASGVKRRTRHHTVNRNMALGWVDKRELLPSDIQNTLQTDYIANKVYEDGALKRILTEEGYVEKEGNLFRHYYYIRDYLGNNRLVADASGNLVQKNYYYAFGLPQTYGTQQQKQPYKFNGKEMERMLDMNWYDYSARFFDPAMARFTTMDPLAEKYYSVSPYVYCGNNPVNAIDPDGRSTWVMNNGDGTYRVVGGDLEDKDYNIYVYSIKDGQLSRGESIGVTTSTTSFYDDTMNGDTGKAWGWIGTIDTNDKSGENFLGEIFGNTPSLDEYMPNATRGQTYDFKRTNGTNTAIYDTEPEFYRGMPIGSKDGKTVYTSARDIGNITAGYVAGANGMPWGASRVAFDALQSRESGRPAIEGSPTRNAEYFGWRLGNANVTPLTKLNNFKKALKSFLGF
jgi:RHS repeat-associated protein